VVPFSVLVATLAAAAAGVDVPALGDVRFEYPIVAEAPRVIHVVAGADTITVSSSTGPDTPADRWTRHCSARIITGLPAEPAAEGGQTPEISWDPATITELQRKSGVEGQPFEWTVTGGQAVPGGLRAQVSVPDASVVALVDAAVHLARLLDGTEALMLPSALAAVSLGAGSAGDAVVDVHRRAGGTGELVADVTARAADGGALIDLRGLRYALVDSVPMTADAGLAAAPAT
jgi:hypothetical protein